MLVVMDVVQEILSEPWRIAAALFLAYFIQTSFANLTKRKDLPPFYSESPYIPWLGSLVQFATGPREFIQRAAKAKGNCFTIQLFGKQMTFLTGSEGHKHFFRQREHVFDIREAYAMTVITFGPGVCYDCPQSKMAQQFAFFKDGLSDQCFIEYMDLVQDEVAKYFEQEWGDEGEADLLQSLSDLFTLTSSRCLLGDEIRSRWNKSGMAEHYSKWNILALLLFFNGLGQYSPGTVIFQSPWITRLCQFCFSSHPFQIHIKTNVLRHENFLPKSFKKLLTNVMKRKRLIPTINLLKTFCKFSLMQSTEMERP